MTRARTSPLSGCRTLLRLHRALDFIMHLFDGMTTMSADDKMSAVTWQAYDDTIAKYVPPFVHAHLSISVYPFPVNHALRPIIHIVLNGKVVCRTIGWQAGMTCYC